MAQWSSKTGSWELRNFNPDDFFDISITFLPILRMQCALFFDKYLLDVLPDPSSRILIQEFSGYLFTKLKLEKMLMLTGSGANGKSVFFNVLSSLVGKITCSHIQ